GQRLDALSHLGQSLSLGDRGYLPVGPQQGLGRGHGLLAGQLGEAIGSIEVSTYRVDDHAVVLLGPRGEETKQRRVEATKVFHAAGTHGQRYRAQAHGRTQTLRHVLLRPNPREWVGDEATWAHEQHRRVPGLYHPVEQL